MNDEDRAVLYSQRKPNLHVKLLHPKNHELELRSCKSQDGTKYKFSSTHETSKPLKTRLYSRWALDPLTALKNWFNAHAERVSPKEQHRVLSASGAYGCEQQQYVKFLELLVTSGFGQS